MSVVSDGLEQGLSVRSVASADVGASTHTPSTSHRCSRVSDPFRFDTALLTEEKEPSHVSPRAGLRIAGVDEAGRGCLAGPLVAAAVILDYERAPFKRLARLTDSKLLSVTAREDLYGEILSNATKVAWATCSPQTIDSDGLHRSNLSALRRALELLEDDYRLAIVDGFDLDRADLRARAIVAADFKSAVVAAASVVAKVVRDRLMKNLAPLHPEYGFADHVGYGTERHRQALLKNGPCPLHRLSFRGVDSRQLTFPE